MIDIQLRDYGLESANEVLAPIDEDCNDVGIQGSDTVVAETKDGHARIKAFLISRWESSLDCTLHSARHQFCCASCNQTDVQANDEGLMSKRVARYLKGIKTLNMCIKIRTNQLIRLRLKAGATQISPWTSLTESQCQDAC